MFEWMFDPILICEMDFDFFSKIYQGFHYMHLLINYDQK